MNYTKLFYWLTVADNAKTMFVVGIIIFTIIGVVATIAYLANSGEEQKLARKWMWWSYPFMILFWTLYIFTPNKRDALLIVAGGQTLNFLTTDITAKSIPHELTMFIVTELKSMAADAKVDLNISNQKEKVLNEARNMTVDELINRMNVDSSFAKIVLNK